jgi:peptide/nickel transport system substrate-binding protein
VPAKYGCKSSSSAMCDPEFDARVNKVATLTGDARTEGWREIHRYLYEDVMPSVFMYHMVGYARVSKRVDYVPDITTASEIRIQEINFR